MKALNRHFGASLFELVAAIAVATVLIAILVVSSRTFLTRTRMSRVLEEQRQIRASLEKYHIDTGALPTTEEGLGVLVSGNGYMASLPIDPFDPTGKLPYLYLRPDPESSSYILASRGPDADFDVPEGLLATMTHGGSTTSLRALPGAPLPGDAPATAGDSKDGGRGHGAAEQQETAKPLSSEETFTLLGEYLQEHSYTPGASSNDGDIIALSR